jgi:hypothetical protein
LSLRIYYFVGRWKSALERFYGPQTGRLIEHFVNWPSAPESVLLFTKKYGPLDQKPAPGDEFRFQLSAWNKRQTGFRSTWRDAKLFTGEWDVSDENGGLTYEDGRLMYKSPSLRSFLGLDLMTCPLDRLKICMRPGCPNPYFIAHHRQKFCSQICAGWIQRQWKKKWWDRNGTEWRKKRDKSKSRNRH